MIAAEPEKQSNKSNKSKRGGRREGSGRKKGKLSAAKIELRDLAREHVPTMLKALVDIANNSDSDSARVSAIKEVLDRAYGKAPQAIVGDPENPIATVTRVELIAAIGNDSED